MVLLSTHNLCFGWEIRKVFCYALLTKVLTNLDCLYPQTYKWVKVFRIIAELIEIQRQKAEFCKFENFWGGFLFSRTFAYEKIFA